MRIDKCLGHAFRMVLHSKLRSWLTILGIVIGVGAVVAIMSLGTGMEESINNQMGDLGGDQLTITAGFSRGFSSFGPGRSRDSGDTASTDEVVLDRSDLQVLKGISDLKYIDTRISGRVDVAYLGETGTVSLTGVDQKVWSFVQTSDVAEGRLLDSADSNVVVIGGRLADGYFDDPIGINQMLSIEGSSFRVVGVLDDTSTSIYMPIQTAYQVLEDSTRDQYDSIIVVVDDEEQIDATMEKIEKKLMLSRHVNEKDKDFTITSNKEILETRSEMMSSMNLFLTAIAAVSLLVGAVGIANTMFTSVLERTKQIGIMKAIGARNRDILTMFILNAALIGLIGGILGVLLGMALSGVVPSLLGGTPMGRGGTYVTMDSVVLALSVSMAVGLIAGIVPAIQASRLKPVDALRFE